MRRNLTVRTERVQSEVTARYLREGAARLRGDVGPAARVSLFEIAEAVRRTSLISGEDAAHMTRSSSPDVSRNELGLQRRVMSFF